MTDGIVLQDLETELGIVRMIEARTECNLELIDHFYERLRIKRKIYLGNLQNQRKKILEKVQEKGSRGITNGEKRKGERKQRLKRMRKLMLRNLKLKQR